MNSEHATASQEYTPLAAKWALVAALFLLAVALVLFAIMTALVSIGEHISPMTAIFGPMPGMPLITWLYYTLPAAAFQGLVGLALRHAIPAVRVAGVVGALVVATVALVWLGGIVYIGVRWLVTGVLAGDYQDLLGMVSLGIPILLVTSVLDIRAALIGVRELIGRRATPVPH